MDEPYAKQRYTLHTRPDGRVFGRCWTDDDEDTGYPSTEAEWTVRYQDRVHAIKATGGTHTGVSGVRVTVILDGIEINPEGNALR